MQEKVKDSSMKKHTIKVFDSDDKFFIYNKLFQKMHSLMRKSVEKYILGYENGSLVIYSSENDFQKLLNSEKVRNFYNGKAFTYEVSEISEKEPYLKRVNNMQQIDKKLQDKKNYYKKIGLSEEIIQEKIDKYKSGLKKKAKSSIHFIAKKNNVKIMIFAEIDCGNIFSLKTNSYGLSKRGL